MTLIYPPDISQSWIARWRVQLQNFRQGNSEIENTKLNVPKPLIFLTNTDHINFLTNVAKSHSAEYRVFPIHFKLMWEFGVCFSISRVECVFQFDWSVLSREIDALTSSLVSGADKGDEGRKVWLISCHFYNSNKSGHIGKQHIWVRLRRISWMKWLKWTRDEGNNRSRHK